MQRCEQHVCSLFGILEHMRIIGILLVLFLFPHVIHAGVVEDRRAELERQLQSIEAQIQQEENLLASKQKERSSLERDVAILNAKIKRSQLAIRARTIAIQKLNVGISDKAETIAALTEKLNREKASLAQILRKTQKIDDLSIVEVVLSKDKLSDIFGDLDNFAVLQQSLSFSFKEIADTQENTKAQKEVLTGKRADEIELRELQRLEKNKIVRLQQEKKKILNATKGEEAAYQALLKKTKKTAAQIRAELFTLRDSAAIPFGEALAFAEKASKGTGVRPAVILGVLKQETRLGEFLGTGNWKVDMHPTRDRPVFRYIMDTLGLDPDKMPVSKAPGYGWGGAMGPSQFIPSTWVCYGGFVNQKTGDCNNAARSLSWNDFWQGPWVYKASKDRIRRAIGGTDPSNPYNNEDAFTATALLMADNGADRGTRSAERLAALRYFAGWRNAEKPQYAFYGDSVMSHADFFQEQINILEGK